jgi:hypothetical protein
MALIMALIISHIDDYNGANNGAIMATNMALIMIAYPMTNNGANIAHI